MVSNKGISFSFYNFLEKYNGPSHSKRFGISDSVLIIPVVDSGLGLSGYQADEIIANTGLLSRCDMIKQNESELANNPR